MARIIELTPAILKALGEGLARLHDGDESDLLAADEVERTLHALGLVRTPWAWIPIEKSTCGFTRIEGITRYVSMDYHGSWRLPSGSYDLYKDKQLKLLLRTINIP